MAADAHCASGECCDLETCQIKPVATVCRKATNSCDLPEYCDGQMEYCPADFYVQDGHVCPDHADVNFLNNISKYWERSPLVFMLYCFSFSIIYQKNCIINW